MGSLLRTRRWIAFTLLVVVAIAAFGLLSRWQWLRAEDRRVERVTLAAESSAAPVGAAEAVESGAPEWTPVVAVGRYDSERTVLVRQRPLDGRNGFWVATPLIVEGGPTVWVVRGWIPAGASAVEQVVPPTAPEGTVRVQARLRSAEASPGPTPDDLPAGQVPRMDPSRLGVGVAGVYLEAIASNPADPEVTALPLPVIDEGRNISYAVQWILFALVAMAGWFFFLRREASTVAAEGKDATWTSV